TLPTDRFPLSVSAESASPTATPVQMTSSSTNDSPASSITREATALSESSQMTSSMMTNRSPAVSSSATTSGVQSSPSSPHSQPSLVQRAPNVFGRVAPTFGVAPASWFSNSVRPQQSRETRTQMTSSSASRPLAPVRQEAEEDTLLRQSIDYYREEFRGSSFM
ncbi:hypothetical protein PENTCL1PPCAC_3301, partial [Pristionchus entomophagus]